MKNFLVGGWFRTFVVILGIAYLILKGVYTPTPSSWDVIFIGIWLMNIHFAIFHDE